jgi:serine/threonine-protein kinase
MEYLEGTDLGTLLEQRGALPVVEAVDYVLQACEAVAEAHALGIIHRDLKPRNLFVTSRVDGRPLIKVLDFGISKLMASAASGPQSVQQMSLTKTSDVMGSPMYMSPEQLRSSRRVDERSDVWSFGVILYELLTARVPFEAESVTELCAMLLQDTPVPVSQLRPEVPPGIAAAIDRCLQKDPAARFQSVAELATALEALGPPGAKDMAERVRMVAATGAAARSSSLPEASVPSVPAVSSRVAVTGGTSVSWGETQLASKIGPVPRSRWPFALALAGAVAVGAMALVAWRAYGPAADAPGTHAQGATAGGTASGTTAHAGDQGPTTQPGATAATLPSTTAMPKIALTPIPPPAVPTASAKVTVARPVGAIAPVRPPPSSTGAAAARPGTTAPAATITAAATHRGDELPNERE